jgi:hypothetical protein
MRVEINKRIPGHGFAGYVSSNFNVHYAPDQCVTIDAVWDHVDEPTRRQLGEILAMANVMVNDERKWQLRDQHDVAAKHKVNTIFERRIGAWAKLAVFSTSEIQSCGASAKGEIVLSDYDRGRSPIRKTDKLQAALDQGYCVLVVTTRPKLGDHDQWWVKQVGKDNIFMATYRVDENDNGGATSPSTCAGWRELYSKLGLDWPVNSYEAEGERFTNDGSWCDARWGLKNKGIALGCDF